jgi:protein-tyrosine phosphatase
MGTHQVPTGVDHLVIGLHDSNVDDNPNLAFVLTEIADTIRDDVARGRCVYVHCVAAHNRTPAVAAAYLIRRGSHTVDEALAAVEAALGRCPDPFLVSAGSGSCSQSALPDDQAMASTRPA